VKHWQYAAFGGPEQLELVESARPEPGPGEVLIRVTRCGVNPIDVSTMSGRFKGLGLPHTPGVEVAGVAEALGAGVSDPPVGARVAMAFRLFCNRCYYCLRGREIDCAGFAQAPGPAIFGVITNGGMGEYVVVPALNALLVPDEVSDDHACAAALDGITAYHLVDRAGVRDGETVLVVGATGGVGSFAVQIAAQRGATILALGRGPEAEARLRGWGATAVLDRDAHDVAARVQELSAGRGVDVALDPVGAGTWPLSMGALAQGGRYATCGILTGAEVQLNLGPFYTRQQQVIGSTGGSRGDLATVLAALQAGRIEAPIWRTFPLEEAPAAFAALKEPGRIGKVLLAVSSP
jgi:NADPH:quinone reductase-like Zn-dependent oxidoreductase